MKGHAHWSVCDEDSPAKIYAFDFDSETFKLFPSPPEGSHVHYKSLAVLKGCLCQCLRVGSEFSIWVMKEYGIKTSWRKDVIIKQGISLDLDFLLWPRPVHLIECLRDGTILMACYKETLYAYSSFGRLWNHLKTMVYAYQNLVTRIKKAF